MSVSVATSGTHARNWRRTMLYTFEVVFALIAGSSEATIYYGYSPSSPWDWTRVAEAVLRAAITQVCVVFFAVAAVEAASRMRSIPGKIAAAFPAWIATLIAALITYWMMHGAALIFRDAALLAPAESGSIALPIVGTITNESIDLFVVAAIPFFQLGLNVLAPIIAADPIVETTDARRDRMQREREEAEHKQAMHALNAGGFGRALRAGIEGVKAVASAETNPVQSPDEPPANEPGDTHDKPSPSPRHATGRKPVPAGQWTRSHLQRYAQAKYGVAIGDEAATRHMATLGNGRRLEGVTGQPYTAHKATVKAWVDRTYGAGNASGETATLAG